MGADENEALTLARGRKRGGGQGDDCERMRKPRRQWKERIWKM